jgi:NADPH-dependent 2,4-dienoyl-CoA reductase/sulfur reductase-like enzyme/rhodanese-related sulfurtransferase
MVVIGGVAAGATAAARARRLSEEADITVLERGPYVSYANCGLPYFLSGDLESRSTLLLQTPESFKRRYRVDVQVETEVLSIDRAAQVVRAKGPSGELNYPYDVLVLAQGGSPVLPPVPGSDARHVFRLWTVPDMDRLQTFMVEAHPQHAVVVGGGFIGLEMAEAFRKRGLTTSVIELAPSVMNTMDASFGVQVRRELERHQVSVHTGVSLKAVHEREVELSNGQRVPADVVLFSVGVRPETSLAKAAGLEVGPSGGVVVDSHLRTSDHRIFAAGDMAEITHRISGKKVRVPLAGPANRQGRIAASNALGQALEYHGALGSSVVKVFDATAASTGLTERAAREAGFEVGVAVLHKDHHASAFPGGKELTLQLVYERASLRLLGAQAFGLAGVDKRIDVCAMALQQKATLEDLAEVDLAYSPPYSSANDPVNLAAFIGLNDVTGYAPLITAAGLAAALASKQPPLVLDVRTPNEWAQGHLEGAVHIPLDALRGRLTELPRERAIVVHCRSGFRAHLALRILQASGFARVTNLTGGSVSWVNEPGFTLSGQ